MCMQQVAPAPTIFLREEIHVHPPRFSKKKTTSVVDELVGKRLTELAASLTTVQKLDSPIAASTRICNKIYKTACFKEIVKEMDPRISEAALPKPLRPEHV